MYGLAYRDVMVIDEFKTKSFFFLLSLCNCKLQFRAQ